MRVTVRKFLQVERGILTTRRRTRFDVILCDTVTDMRYDDISHTRIKYLSIFNKFNIGISYMCLLYYVKHI